MSGEIITAPFTPEQVEALNEFQQRPNWHPFTCGNCVNEVLAAFEDGWHCARCDYRQRWAHAFMANRSKWK